ncbi:MAG: hypothetical protein ACSHW0_19530 [Thalassotalea sp.]
MNFNSIHYSLIGVLLSLVSYFAYINITTDVRGLNVNYQKDKDQSYRTWCYGASGMHISISESGLINHAEKVFTQSELIMHLKKDYARQPFYSVVIKASLDAKHKKVVSLTSKLNEYFPELILTWDH